MIRYYDVQEGLSGFSASLFDQIMVRSTEDTSTMNTVNLNKDSLEEDILDSLEFSDAVSNTSNDVNPINNNDLILEIIDYSEFSDKDEE